MGRPQKNTADYFPHYCQSGRTIIILENKFGNNGYAFWFKLLEILIKTEGHAFDCNSRRNWEFFVATMRLDEATCLEIINALIELEKIDRSLWNKKIIWVQSLVNNISFLYDKRKKGKPQKPNTAKSFDSFSLSENDIEKNSFCCGNSSKTEFLLRKPLENGVSVAETPEKNSFCCGNPSKTEFLLRKPLENGVSVAETRTKKKKKKKEKKKKRKKKRKKKKKEPKKKK